MREWEIGAVENIHGALPYIRFAPLLALVGVGVNRIGKQQPSADGDAAPSFLPVEVVPGAGFTTAGIGRADQDCVVERSPGERERAVQCGHAVSRGLGAGRMIPVPSSTRVRLACSTRFSVDFPANAGGALPAAGAGSPPQSARSLHPGSWRKAS